MLVHQWKLVLNWGCSTNIHHWSSKGNVKCFGSQSLLLLLFAWNIYSLHYQRWCFQRKAQSWMIWSLWHLLSPVSICCSVDVHLQDSHVQPWLKDLFNLNAYFTNTVTSLILFLFFLTDVLFAWQTLPWEIQFDFFLVCIYTTKTALRTG